MTDHVPETTSDGFLNSTTVSGLNLSNNLFDFLLSSSSITVRSHFSLSLMNEISRCWVGNPSVFNSTQIRFGVLNSDMLAKCYSFKLTVN